MLKITLEGLILGLDILIASKVGNMHLDFRNSLLKYARNKRRDNSVIIRITVDQPLKEKIKAVSFSLFFYHNLADNLHWRSTLNTWHGAVSSPKIFKNWFSGRKFKWRCDIMYMEFAVLVTDFWVKTYCRPNWKFLRQLCMWITLPILFTRINFV